MSKGLSAIVLCAGKGTRMKSDKAKVLHPVLGRPLCFYPVARALDLGASPVVAVVGHQADQVTSWLRSAFPSQPMEFAIQHQQSGTADAVRAAESTLKRVAHPILILYGDVPLLRRETLQRLWDGFRAARAPLAMATLELEDPTGYGRVLRRRGAIVRVVEHKDCSPAQLRVNEVNAGIYVVDPEFLWKSLGRTKPSNAQREFYLTDLVELAAAKAKVAFISVMPEEASGVNDRSELAECARVLQARINREHMKAGVTLADPRSAFIAEGVEIGRDTEIGPAVSILGRSRIASGVSIGQGCILVDSEVGEGSQIRAYSVLEEANVGGRCLIGPFARLRPGTELEEAVHIGNFVETKKAHIGRGSKANHLSYLGDAQVGAGVNIGAGTITCNYDGVNKHRTVLGDGVFVGSDSQLVAPVTVGEGAYIGAGTTVTEDVPPKSLALSRSPQVVKAGWVEKKKKSRARSGSGW